MYVVTGLSLMRAALLSALVAGVSACGPTNRNAPLVKGPAAEDIVTPFEDALLCLNGRVDTRLSFGVGGIPDQTGKEQNSNEGAGRFVTQGAGDIVQSALFKTGVTVINRRDMGSAVMESQWGIRDLAAQQPAHLVITGSINSLDFIPGGGAFVNVRGVGPRYRQHRILVGMDLVLTNNTTGQVLANIALHKQLFADELGFAGTRFVGDRLVDSDIGIARREAVHYALRKMLQLATFELLVQLMPPERYAECAEMIDPRFGKIRGGRTSGEQLRKHEERILRQSTRSAAAAPAGDGDGDGDAAPVAATASDATDAAAAQAEPTAQAPEQTPETAAQAAAEGAMQAPANPAGMAPEHRASTPHGAQTAREASAAATEPSDAPAADAPAPIFPVGEPVPDRAQDPQVPEFHIGEIELAAATTRESPHAR